MADIKLIRWSGRPPELADLEAYENEFKANYDRIYAELQAKGAVDMLEMQAQLAELDKQLNAKYTLIVSVPFPRSRKAMTSLVDRFGAPVMAARAQDGTNELILVVYDKQFAE